MVFVRLTVAVDRYKRTSARIIQIIQWVRARQLADDLQIGIHAAGEKRLGTRRQFTTWEMEKLIERYGTDQDRLYLRQFISIRTNLHQTLKGHPTRLSTFWRLLGHTSGSRLTLLRDQPESWRLDELTTLGKHLDTLPGKQWTHFEVDE